MLLSTKEEGLQHKPFMFAATTLLWIPGFVPLLFNICEVRHAHVYHVLVLVLVLVLQLMMLLQLPLHLTMIMPL